MAEGISRINSKQDIEMSVSEEGKIVDFRS